MVRQLKREVKRDFDPNPILDAGFKAESKNVFRHYARGVWSDSKTIRDSIIYDESMRHFVFAEFKLDEGRYYSLGMNVTTIRRDGLAQFLKEWKFKKLIEAV